MALSVLETSTVSAMVRPPSTQSLQERRTNTGRSSGQTSWTAAVTSNSARARFSSEPPYSSVR